MPGTALLDEAPPASRKTSVMEIMDLGGDTKLQWSKDNRDEVQSARRTFDELKAKGFMAFSVEGKPGKQGKQGTVLNTFDETAERIIMTPPMAGG